MHRHRRLDSGIVTEGLVILEKDFHSQQTSSLLRKNFYLFFAFHLRHWPKAKSLSMDIDIHMGGMPSPQSEEGAVSDDPTPQDLLNGKSNFPFPAIQPELPQTPSDSPPESVVVHDAPSATHDARACQAPRSRSNSIEQPRPASRRDLIFESLSAHHAPPHLSPRIRSRIRSRHASLYPDYWTPSYSSRDKPFDRSRRAEELFDNVPGKERSISALVFRMTDMDVGRDDRYRGSGQRGGNKRRRDGKLRAGRCAGTQASKLPGGLGIAVQERRNRVLTGRHATVCVEAH